MLSFGALYESSTRLKAMQDLEQFYTNLVSSQGDNKAVKEFTKKWSNIIDDNGKTDEDEFKRAFGRGKQ